VRTWMLMMLGATLAFGQTPPTDTVQRCRKILDDAIHDGNPDTRKSGAEALSLVGIKDNALESLGPMIDDHDVQVRIAVVNSLGDFKDPQTLPLLKRALRDPTPDVDLAAAKVLYQLNDPEGTNFLLAAVDGEVKVSSGQITRTKRSAVRLLHTPHKLLLFVGIEAIGFAPVPGLGLGLCSAYGIMMNTDSSARSASLLLMGKSGDPALADAVGSSLSSKDWSLRAAAVHLAAMHPFPQFRDKLVPLLDDKKVAVRVRAAAAYIRLQSNTTEEEPKKEAAWEPHAAATQTAQPRIPEPVCGVSED
jgi:HEAT repeat protein